MGRLDAILGAGGLGAFKGQGPLHAGLPSRAYTDPAFLELEFETLFRDGWVFTGFAHELPNPGDAQPVEVGGLPLFLIRGKSGEIQAFHNVCRHRCAKLLDQLGNVGPVIRCPYHAWVYGLDGALRSAPHFGGPETHFPEGFAREDYGLRPVRSVTWGDWVFVNVSGDAEDFEVYAKPLIDRFAGLDLAAIKPIGAIDFGEVPTNWKFLMENFMEPYHVQFLHSSTTNQPLLDHSTIVEGPCLGSAVDVAESQQAKAEERQGDTLPQTLDVSSRYLTLFPSFVLGWYFPDQMGVYLNQPVAPGITRQRRMLYHSRADQITTEEVEAIKTLWTGVHKEDHWICERLQQGRRSPVADEGGVLSPHWETPVRRFQEMIVEACNR